MHVHDRITAYGMASNPVERLLISGVTRAEGPAYSLETVMMHLIWGRWNLLRGR